MKEKIILDGVIIFPLHNKVVIQEKETRIEPKIMRVLCFLIDNPNKAISREEIANHISPDSVTGLDVVTRAIFEIRKVLNDNAKSPKYIETIPRKGYCFIGTEPDSTNEKSQTFNKFDNSSDIEKNNDNFLGWNRTAIIIVIFCILFIAVIKSSGILSSHNDADLSPKDQVNTSNFRSQLLSNRDDNAKSPALSKNMKMALFLVSQSNTNSLPNKLVLLDISTRNRTIIAESNNRFVSPIWDESSESFYYGICDKSQCKVMQYLLGSAEEALLFQTDQQLLSIDLSNTLQLIAISTLSKRGRIVSLLDLDGNPLIESIAASDEHKLGKAFFSADGSKLYLIGYKGRKAKQFFQYDLSTNILREISHDFELIFDLTNKTKGKVWVAARKNGKSAIWSFNSNTDKFVKEIEGQPGEFQTALSAAQDGRALLYRSLKRDINILFLGQINTPEKKGINANLIDMNGVYIPSSNEFIFTSNRTGSHEIWVYSNDSLEKLTDISANLIERPIVSRDEGRVAFITSVGNISYLYILNLVNKEIKGGYEVPQQSFALGWSASDKQVFISAFKNGQYSIHEIDLTSGKLKQRNINAGLIAHQQPNGDFYFANLLTGSLMLESKNGEISSIYQLPAGLRPLMPHQARIIGEQLFYIADNGEEKNLVSVSLTTKEEIVHFGLPVDSYVTQIGLSASTDELIGKPFVIYDKLVKDAAQLILVEEID